jgi:hypothetical protein
MWYIPRHYPKTEEILKRTQSGQPSNPDDIQIGYLLNASPEHCQYTNLFVKKNDTILITKINLTMSLESIT